MTKTDAMTLATRTNLAQLTEQQLWDFTLLLDPHCDQLPVDLTIFSAWLDAHLLMENTAVQGVDYSKFNQRVFNHASRFSNHATMQTTGE